MHLCPHCRQELKTFGINCIRCSREVGKVTTDGVMLAVWWLDRSGELSEKIALKTLMKENVAVDADSIEYALSPGGGSKVVITLANGEEIPQSLREFFREASGSAQEWYI